MADAFSVVTKVTTPISLAALFFVVSAGILQILVRQQHARSERRLLLKYGFYLAMMLSVLANATFLVTTLLNREIRVSGTVRDENGEGLGWAVVDIPGKGRGVTDKEGEFEFSIPNSLGEHIYAASARLIGYETVSKQIPGRYPEVTEFRLKKLSAVDEINVDIEDEMFIKHLIGIPSVEIRIVASNQIPKPLGIGQFSVALLSPTSKTTLLPLQALSFDGGASFPYNLPTSPIPVSLGDDQHLDLGFSYSDSDMSNLFAKASAQYVPHNGEHYPDGSKKVYTDALTNELKQYMDAHFIWEKGEWQLTLYYVVNGRKKGIVKHFTIAGDTERKMRNIANYYGFGIGLVPAWQYGSGADYNPFAVINLRK